jgi:DNA-binding protein YbaB
MDLDLFTTQLGSARVSGAAANGRAKAVVDGTGRLVDLDLAPDLLRRPAKDVTEAVVAAVTNAQDAARAQGTAHVTEMREALERQMSADVEEANRDAERSLEELRTLVSDVARMTERLR